MMILYTASAIVEGQDTFLPTVAPTLKQLGLAYQYDEIDPDVFGEELDTAAYQRADRIAVVALVIKK